MAGRVITIAQQKGGAGKTTLAAHLAIAWAGEGRSVALLDIDPQGSLATWHRLRGDRFGTGKPGSISRRSPVGVPRRRSRGGPATTTSS
jgi:chromosome partitioning protein